jgi:hypothetical protein
MLGTDYKNSAGPKQMIKYPQKIALLDFNRRPELSFDGARGRHEMFL